MTYKIITKRINKTKKQRWQERVVFGRPKALKICKYPTYISYLHSQISSAFGHPWKLEQRNLLVEKTDGCTHSLKNTFLI